MAKEFFFAIITHYGVTKNWQFFMKPIEYILKIFQIKTNINLEIAMLLGDILNIAFKDKIKSIQKIVVQYLHNVDNLFESILYRTTWLDMVNVSDIQVKPFLSLIIKP